MGWANQLCKNVVPSFTRLYCYIIYLLNNILDSIHLSSQWKEIKFPKSFQKVPVPITSQDFYLPDGSQGTFLLNEWRKKVHHCNLKSLGSHSMPATMKRLKSQQFRFKKKNILPVKTFHHLVTDCHMWWNPSYNDYQGFLLLFLAEILKKVELIFSNLFKNDEI